MVQTVGERFNFNFFFVLPVLLLERGAVTQHAAGGQHVQTDSVGRHACLSVWHRSERLLLRSFLVFRPETKETIRNSAPAPVLRATSGQYQAYLLGLLAKIKCSICSYQLNLWYVAHGVT